MNGEEGDEGQFFQNELAWSPVNPETDFGEPTARYSRDAPEGKESYQREMTILQTNYFSYAVGASCAQKEEDGAAYHSIDYFVLMRDKSPAKFIRKLAREALLSAGLDSDTIGAMVKSQTKKCWGKDTYE